MFQEINGIITGQPSFIDCKVLCSIDCYNSSNAALLIYDKVEIRVASAEE